MGVEGPAVYARTLAHAGTWLGLAPLAARILARLGARQALRRLESRWAAGVRRALDIRLTLDGTENIAPGETYIVTPLHEGLADAVALFHLPLSLRFVVRDELRSWRWLGPLLHETGQLWICPERGVGSYRGLLRAAREVIAAGESLVVFPQGTILGIETDFHAGAFHLARALDRPILPVALTGSHRVWEHPYTPRVRYGQPVGLRVLSPVPVNEVRRTAPEMLRVRVRDRLKCAALDGTIAEPRRFQPERDGYWDGYAYAIDPRFAELAADVARHRATVATVGGRPLSQPRVV